MNKDKNRKVRAIIFDLGGTITVNGVYTAFPIYDKKLGLKVGALKSIMDKYFLEDLEKGRLSEADFWKGMAKKSGKNLSGLRNLVIANFREIPGMRDILRRCKKNYKTGLLTNNVISWYRIHLKKHGLKKLFDIRINSSYLGIRKPGKEIYLITSRRLGVEPNECIFVDDLEENVRGARKAGMISFQFKSPKQTEKQLKKLGVKI